ncbi:MAG: DUF86 domain-containing protein [Chloroflexota bacterium]
MNRDEVYLRHILDAVARIDEYLLEIDERTFQQRYLIQDAVIRQLEIIGEAVKNVSHGLRDRYPQIPWQDIAGARDKLIHHYFGVDIDKVWLMVKDDIPILKESVLEIIDDLENP